MTNNKISVVLVGVGGYGQTYLKELLFKKDKRISLVGVVDILPQQSQYYKDILEQDVPIFKTLEQFYQAYKADLAIISTPIHLHKEHSVSAMKSGSHVLCEKPIATDLEHIKEMKKVSSDTGKFLAVGFNWSFTSSVQSLKRDILSGKFGKSKRFKTIILWPRTKDYYNRSSWAGKQYHTNGDIIYDNIASNATAHYLHHLLYLDGSTMENSAELTNLTAELYRANDIETFDTCAVKIRTKSNLKLYYYATHAVNEVENPKYTLEFEKATIYYNQDGTNQNIIARWNDGTIQEYENPNLHPLSKLYVCVNAILEDDYGILCGINASKPHVESVHAMNESMPHPQKFPVNIIQSDDVQQKLYVNGLGDILKHCYDEWCLPSDLKLDWSKRGKDICVK